MTSRRTIISLGAAGRTARPLRRSPSATPAGLPDDARSGAEHGIAFARRSPEGLRFIGAALAFLLCLAGAIALVALAASPPLSWTTARTWALLGALAAGLGAIVGSVLGWQQAGMASDRRVPVARATLSVSWRAVLAGAALIAGLSLVTPGDDYSQIDDRIQLADIAARVLVPVTIRAGWALTTLTFGLILFSIPATIVIAPLVTIWITVLRRIVADPSPR